MPARIWDTLFFLFALAPFLTGGFWWHQPGFRFDITDSGLAAVALFFFAWQAEKHGVRIWEKSWFCRNGSLLWERWKAGLESRPLLFLGMGWLVFSTLQFLTSYSRHQAFSSGLADLGIFTNAISNVSSMGFPFSSLKNGQSLLADHQNFLIYPLGWIFPIWPSPIFLLFLQAYLVSTGAVALFLLGRQRLGFSSNTTAWLPLTFWLCGPLRAALRFDFHPEIFMLPLFLFATFLLQELSWKKRAWGTFLLLPALAAKESAGPVACGLGIAWILGAGPAATRNFTRAIGLALTAIGAGVFYADSQVAPALLGVHYAYSDLYEPLPSNLGSLALAPFSNPSLFFGRLFSISRIKFFLGTLMPLGFLPLISPAAIACLPGFLMLFLTKGDHRISLGYHYSLEPLTGLFFALPSALEKISKNRWKNKALPILALGSALSFGKSDPYFWRIYNSTTLHSWVRDDVIPNIPAQLRVAASYGLVPHLSVRQWVNQIPLYEDDRQRLVDCVLIDESINNTPLGLLDMQRARAIVQAQEYIEEIKCDSFSLYRSKDTSSCLQKNPRPCPLSPPEGSASPR